MIGNLDDEDEFGTHTMDKYTKEKKVGEGAYGIVFKGHDTVTNEVVAVKKIHIEVNQKILKYRMRLKEFLQLQLEKYLF